MSAFGTKHSEKAAERLAAGTFIDLEAARALTQAPRVPGVVPPASNTFFALQ